MMSNKLCLKWNDFKDIRNSSFGNLRNDVDFADVTLACEEGQQVKAQLRRFLAAVSPFFQNSLKTTQQ
jgi:BTB/POZ domain.